MRVITSSRFRFTIFLVLLPTLAWAAPDPNSPSVAQSMLHSLDYLAVDYPHSVHAGIIIDPEEYAEQREFAQQLLTQINHLPDQGNQAVLRQQVDGLVAAIEQRATGEHVQSLCAALSSALITTYQVQIAPLHIPRLDKAAALFQANCASCHGPKGLGNGPLAAALRPPPSNFHDRDRQRQRSVYGLYSTITLGVKGTAMPSFNQLREDERWALAFYVSDFFASSDERARGKALWQAGEYRALFPNVGQLTQATPAATAAQNGNKGLAVLAYLRTAPDRVTPGQSDPLALSREKLGQSLAAYRAGDVSRAYDLAVNAYLEGFELTEVGLRAIDPGLTQTIETAMSHYRQAIKQNVPGDALATRVAHLQGLLKQAGERLASTSLAPSTGFASAFIILLREGLEAILILAAIAAFLSKVQRRDALRYVHTGWIAALLVGFLTWLAAKYLINYSGASRELTEGFTALFTTAMLVYVGFWLHNYTHTQRWLHFLHDKMHQTLAGGTLWSLALISFIAVYREVVETVLFFETLWIQTQSAGHGYIVSGLISAALVLIVLAWAIFRFSVKLPLRLFFQANAALLLTLAVIFAGKGIVALQKAGKLRADVLPIPTIPVFGIYPTLESIGLQLALICIIVAWMAYKHVQNKRLMTDHEAV